MTKAVAERFERIERNLEIASAINAETARLAKRNELALKRLADIVENAFVRRPNGKLK